MDAVTSLEPGVFRLLTTFYLSPCCSFRPLPFGKCGLRNAALLQGTSDKYGSINLVH